jgi:hypothetical protein
MPPAPITDHTKLTAGKRVRDLLAARIRDVAEPVQHLPDFFRLVTGQIAQHCTARWELRSKSCNDPSPLPGVGP